MVEATNFLVDAGFLSGFAGDLDLEGNRAGFRFLVEPSDWLAPLALCCELLLCCAFSSSESGTSTNRAVGRGPELEGPLEFFRIGCEGGGLDDDGVRFCGACSGWNMSKSPRVPFAIPAWLLAFESDSCMLLVWGICSRGSAICITRATAVAFNPYRRTRVSPGGSQEWNERRTRRNIFP